MKPKTYAVNEVAFIENTSVYSDDFIAHRLGMVCMDVLGDFGSANQLKSPDITLSLMKECIKGEMEVTSDDLRMYEEPEEPVAEGAAKVVNGCHREGEKNGANGKIWHIINGNCGKETCGTTDQETTSSHHKPLGACGMTKSSLKILEGIVLAKIIGGQKIDLTCKVMQGCGEMNARWSPVTKCVYRQYSASPDSDETSSTVENQPMSDTPDGQFLMTLETNRPFSPVKVFWDVWHGYVV